MKRIISILLAVLMLASCAVYSVAAAETEEETPAIPSYSWNEPNAQNIDDALAKYEAENGPVTTNRYYFLMPNGTNGDLGDTDKVGEYAPSWYNKYTTTAGIYWWDSGVADPPAWIGYVPNKCTGAGEEDVYYADVPVEVTSVVWNNGVNGGMDETQEIYFMAAQTVNVGTEYYDPDESPKYPNGTPNFDGMIYVVDPDVVDINELSQKQTCGGDWYYYYGNGCYGVVAGGSEDDCCRGDHNHDAPAFLLGDVDLDGEMSVMDATEIQMVMAQVKVWKDAAICPLAADVDGDGEPSVMDATEIQMIQAGLK